MKSPNILEDDCLQQQQLQRLVADLAWLIVRARKSELTPSKLAANQPNERPRKGVDAQARTQPLFNNLKGLTPKASAK